MNLSKKDYEKILYFMNSTYSNSSTFEKTVQINLSKLFNLDTSLFWLADNQGNMYNLNFYNFDDKVIWDYTETYKNKDVMHPRKQLQNSTIRRENVLKIKETTTTTSFINSEYYDFVKKHHIIDQMVVYLTNGKTIFGGIGFPRFHGEMHFTQKDKAILRSLVAHLQNAVKSSLIINEFEAKNLICENSVETGIIQVQSNKKVTFYNKAAQNIITTVCPDISVEEFFHKTISRYLPVNKTININIDNIELKIAPYHPNEDSISMNYYVYVQSKTETHNIKALLSKRELEIYKYLLKGYTNQQISDELWISINTVKKHLKNMYEKVGVSNRTSLIYELTKSEEVQVIE